MAGTVRLNPAELNRFLRSPGGPVGRDLLRRSHRVENRAKELVGVDLGRLRSSITTDVRADSKGLVGRVGSNVEYALHHHEGTGIYGPRGRPITPKTASVLRFKPKGSSTFVFARSVRGSKPNPFLADALSAARG